MSPDFKFENELAKKVWQSFEKELDHKLRVLPADQRSDIKLELLVHLYESASIHADQEQHISLIEAIDRLGSPDEYLTPLISDILLSMKANDGNPLAIIKSLAGVFSKSLLHGVAAVVFGLMYFFTIMIFIMSVMHIFDPDVGLWVHQSGGFSLSFEPHQNSVQWFPKWFTLIGFVVSVISYYLINKALYLLLKSLKK